MARMIPSIIDPECASEAERHVFQKLKNDPKADQWVVFHSLDIARHETRIKGESDFVIILPGRGVLCLEVKSYVRCAEGLWYYSPHGKPEVRSPFKQASEAMHSIRGQLIAKHPELETLVFWSAVVLPFVTFTAESIEWNNWQVIDQRSLSSQPLRDSLENVLVNGQRLLWESRAKWFKGDAAEPDSRQCKVLVDALRPDFEFYESPRARLDKIARDVKNYTEEQFRALDQMSLNERVVFEGPAGTGKSLLAMEAARRAKTSGRKTLFVCYNKILAKWLQVQTSGLGPLVTTRNLHDHMAHTLGVKLRDTTDDAYWKEELPSKTLEKLSDPDASNSRFDVLIIDEAQDIFSTNYLDVLDLSIEGGLAGGEWRIFGDFATQNIYNIADLSLEEFRKTRSGNATVFSLRTNCRNTPRIAELAQELAGPGFVYSKTLRSDDDIKPVISFYSTQEHQMALLIECLEKLRKDKVNGRNIVILSTRSNVNCIAAKVTEQAWRNRLKPYGTSNDPAAIGFCSIHAFKGMEALVAIVTDVESLDAVRSKSLFYVAVTRTLGPLFILANEKLKDAVPEILKTQRLS